MYKTKQIGATLLELILIIIIVGIIVGGSSNLLMHGIKSYSVSAASIDSDWQASVAIERMSRDLHSIPTSNNFTTATSSRITFTDMTGTSIDYRIIGAQLMRNNQVLADNIQGMAIAYYDRNGASTATVSAIRYVGITLTVSYSPTNISFTNLVNLWNLTS